MYREEGKGITSNVRGWGKEAFFIYRYRETQEVLQCGEKRGVDIWQKGKRQMEVGGQSLNGGRHTCQCGKNYLCSAVHKGGEKSASFESEGGRGGKIYGSDVTGRTVAGFKGEGRNVQKGTGVCVVGKGRKTMGPGAT